MTDPVRRALTQYGDPEAEPTSGATFTATFTVEVGYSNGDFRQVRLLDDRGRARAVSDGGIPWRALREVRDEPVKEKDGR